MRLLLLLRLTCRRITSCQTTVMASLLIVIPHLRVLDEFVCIIGLLVLICHTQILHRLQKHDKNAFRLRQRLDSCVCVIIVYRRLYKTIEMQHPLLTPCLLHLAVMPVSPFLMPFFNHLLLYSHVCPLAKSSVYYLVVLLLTCDQFQQFFTDENFNGTHHYKNTRRTRPTSHALVSLCSCKELLLALAEASVSHPDETNCSIAVEENENSKMRKELGAGQGGKGQETVVEGRPAHETSFKMDSKVLDCNICFSPLKPPIFQCEVGHVLYALCFEKLPHKCVICCKRTGYSRCFALEQFINAIRAPCSNTKYGCDEFITHDQKEKHESLCTHAPCFCPEDGCSFIGSMVSLRDHFVTKHGWLQTNLQYEITLRISIARNRRFALFVGEDLSMFLLINILTDIGNALTLVCIRPQESEPSYSSKISAVHRAAAAEGRLVFQMIPS